MKRKQTDDWGPAIGADRDTPAPKDSPDSWRLRGLVEYFKNILPMSEWGRLNTPVNGPAMMKKLKEMREAGYSATQVREMMEMYVRDIQRKPLPAEVAPWRGFLANLDALAARLSSAGQESYDDLQVDRRPLSE